MHAGTIGYYSATGRTNCKPIGTYMHPHTHVHATAPARTAAQGLRLGLLAIHSSVSPARRQCHTCCSRLSCFVLFERFACDGQAHDASRTLRRQSVNRNAGSNCTALSAQWRCTAAQPHLERGDFFGQTIGVCFGGCALVGKLSLVLLCGRLRLRIQLQMTLRGTGGCSQRVRASQSAAPAASPSSLAP